MIAETTVTTARARDLESTDVVKINGTWPVCGVHARSVRVKFHGAGELTPIGQEAAVPAASREKG